MKCLDNFNAFLAGTANPDTTQGHRFELMPVDSKENLALLEEGLGFPVPESLSIQLTEEGAFHNPHFADVWQTLRLYSAAELLERPKGRFDHLYFDQDSPGEARSKLRAIAAGSIGEFSLEELLEAQFELITEAIEAEE